MFDLEERLRAEARQEAGAFVPSPDLPQRVVTGIRRRRQRAIALASAAAVLVVGLGAAGVAALSGDTGRVEMAPPAGRPTAPPTTVTRRAPVTTASVTTRTTPDDHVDDVDDRGERHAVDDADHARALGTGGPGAGPRPGEPPRVVDRGAPDPGGRHPAGGGGRSRRGRSRGAPTSSRTSAGSASGRTRTASTTSRS